MLPYQFNRIFVAENCFNENAVQSISNFPQTISRSIKEKVYQNLKSFPIKLNSYLKGSNPQPATDVKTLGIKSRAGLTPNPALIPKDVPRVITIRPMSNGAMFEPGPMFLLSRRAKIVPTKIAVARS